MQDMKDDHPVLFDTVEDHVIAVDAPAHAVLLVSRDQRKSIGVIGQSLAFAAQFADESQGSPGLSRAM